MTCSRSTYRTPAGPRTDSKSANRVTGIEIVLSSSSGWSGVEPFARPIVTCAVTASSKRKPSGVNAARIASAAASKAGSCSVPPTQMTRGRRLLGNAPMDDNWSEKGAIDFWSGGGWATISAGDGCPRTAWPTALLKASAIAGRRASSTSPRNASVTCQFSGGIQRARTPSRWSASCAMATYVRATASNGMAAKSLITSGFWASDACPRTDSDFLGKRCLPSYGFRFLGERCLPSYDSGFGQAVLALLLSWAMGKRCLSSCGFRFLGKRCLP